MIIVEDGTGVATANSYVSVADANAYHTLYGNDTWSYRTDLQELALINATLYVDQMYGNLYKGSVSSNTQSLLFPRSQFVDNNGRNISSATIPTALSNAVCEYALVYMNNGQTLIVDPNKDDALTEYSVNVGNGAVQETKKYGVSIRNKNTTKGDIAIMPIINGGGATTSAQRA